MTRHIGITNKFIKVSNFDLILISNESSFNRIVYEMSNEITFN